MRNSILSVFWAPNLIGSVDIWICFSINLIRRQRKTCEKNIDKNSSENDKKWAKNWLHNETWDAKNENENEFNALFASVISVAAALNMPSEIILSAQFEFFT